MSTQPSQRRYRFGPFELDSRTGELLRDFHRIRLQDQPLQALLLLLERPGELVTHEDLRSRVWPDDTHVDFDHGLHGVIGRLRETLGDASDAPTYIETLPRRGYRFLAQVRLVGDDAPHARPASDLASGSGRRHAVPTKDRPPGTRTAAVVALVVAAAGVTGWVLLPHRGPGTAVATRLAVLPFENLTGDDQQQFFVDGFHEELRSRLGRLQPRQLEVIARSSLLTYRAPRKTIAEIARELRVDYVLEGSVRRAESHVRITAQLVRSGDQSQVWAKTYDRTWTDVLAIQKDIGARLADALTLELAGAYTVQFTREATIEPLAYEHYLRGRFFWEHRSRDAQQQLVQAIAEFDRAIERQPDFADAYVGQADAWNSLAFSSAVPGAEGYGRARTAIERALQLDDRSPAAHATHAWMLMNVDHDWEGAERAFERALTLDPNDALNRFRHAHLIALRGSLDEAEREAQAARRLDPRSYLVADFLAFLAWCGGAQDQALRYMQEAADLEPSTARYREFAAYVAAAGDQCDRSVEELTKLKAGADRLPTSSMVAYAVGRCGTDVAQVEAFVNELEARPVPFVMAHFYLGRGDIDRFFVWFNHAIDAGNAEVAYLKVEPSYRPLRSDPRFQAALHRLRLEP